jgi:ectoine hydroxylase-related dioxygenase (phytanoyl-CoA dioxygenase family)
MSIHSENESVSGLPPLDSEYPVLPEQIASFRENGHVLLRGVASLQEIEAYKPLIGTTTGRYNQENRPLEQRDTYAKAFLQVTNLWRRDTGVARFVLARRFAKIAADLMGVDAVRLYHDQALYKEPGGGQTPWHQDQFYWPFETPNMVTMWMPLVDVPVEKGALSFASRSHAKGSVCGLSISDESEREIAAIVEENQFPIAVEDMRAGDATFHGGWTLHRAPANNTRELREVMTIIYFEDGATLATPKSRFQQNDLEAWFPGQKPGEPAASELNPIVYKKQA